MNPPTPTTTSGTNFSCIQNNNKVLNAAKTAAKHPAVTSLVAGILLLIAAVVMFKMCSFGFLTTPTNIALLITGLALTAIGLGKICPVKKAVQSITHNKTQNINQPEIAIPESTH